jgi:hypothetical protein
MPVIQSTLTFPGDYIDLVNDRNSAQYVIHDDLLTHVVRVTRPIAKDEEISIACKYS